MAQNELAQRLGVAAVGIPVAVVVIYAGGWVLAAVLAVAAAWGAVELYRMARATGGRPLVVCGAVGAAAYVLLAGALPRGIDAAPYLWGLTLGGALALSALAILWRGTTGRPLTAVAVTLLGAVWTGGTLAHGVFLRHLADGWLASVVRPVGLPSSAVIGTALVAFAVGLTWINDSAAYFAGRAWGRRKLIPSVSPGKTVVGSVAGVAGAVVVGSIYAGVVLGGWLGLPIGYAEGAVGGALLGVAAQVGDLVESLFKREAGVKDSGKVFPGHGGILDRFDALLFTLPVAYWYLGLVFRSRGVPWP
jgi:phosphatidate cytidylyltransferase